MSFTWRFFWLRKLFGRKNRPSPRPKSVRVRPRLEYLEDRTLLSGDPLTWSVQSDYYDVSGAANEPYSLRGLALSSDNSSLYGGFIQGATSSAAIREVSTTSTNLLIGNDAGLGGDTPNTTGEEAKLTISAQAKGLATDDRGNVYATLSSGSNSSSQEWAIYNSDLSVQEASESSTNYTSTSTLSGIATAKIDGNYYVYVGWKNGQIERWNVDDPADPILDTSWGSAAHPGTISLKTIGADAYLDGLTVDSNGDIYVAGGLSGTTAYGDTLFKITAAEAASGDITSAATATVKGGADGSGGYSAMDVALYNNQAYVTEYLGEDSTIAVFNTSDLSSAGIITPPNLTGPSGLTTTFSPTAPDSGFSDIDISADGQIYVAEQLYNSASNYTPPGGSNPIPGTTYFDRIMVSSAQPVAPTITSADNTTFTVGTDSSFTVTTTGIPAPSLSETGALPTGVTFVDNGDGTATLSGTPDAGTGGTYTFTIIANNVTAPNATQPFILTVDQAPAITSANNTTFTVGTAGSFTVTTTGFPANAALSETGTLPSGVSFLDNGDGTATLFGTPAAGTGGTYNFTITASNGTLPDATQTFTLTVDQAPAITSANSTTFTVGTNGTFIVTATGFPTPVLTANGPVPGGVTFVDNHNGTGTLSGTPAAGSGGTYTFTISASNGVGAEAIQNFTLTVNQAPAITSANSTTFTVGTAGNFTVTTTGFPPDSTLSDGGATLPSGVTFVDNHDGTATLSGTPATGTGGTYNFTITASNGVSPDATQSFTLTVDQAPAITSANNTTFTVGMNGNFTVTTTGFPPDSTLSDGGATLPSGVTFVDNHDGTATLSGTPAAGTGGTYNFTITASNGVSPDATQSFTLTVDQAPAITSANNTTFAVGTPGTFTVTTSGFPAPALSETGALPTGVTFVDNGDGTATLSGTPAAGTGGSYTFTITAHNSTAPDATQTFTLLVKPFSNGSILLLDPTGKASLSAVGHSNVAVTDGGAIIVDSSNAEDALAAGNGQVSAASIVVRGTPGTKTTGHGTFTGAITSGVAVVPDPLSSLPPPAQPATAGTNVHFSGNTVVTLQPGTYEGGIKVSGRATVYLEPGIYYFVNGGLTVSGSAQILMAADAASHPSADTGTGVLLYNASSKATQGITVSGQAIVNLQAPTLGTWQDISLFQNRASSAPITISGNGQLLLNGSVYAAAAKVKLSGNGNLTLTAESSLIAFDLDDAGNGTVNVEP